ncbi:MAG: methylmalonyl-CoA epimerase [Gemmatimonadota bacterium]|nr:methylmalonyl-CoA epimerase [Gemmatimonadota bacterium]
MSYNTETASAVPIIDHVGIAVNSLEMAVPLWTAMLGREPAGEETVESEQVRVAFFGDGAGRVELLEPTGPESAIARHLERRGEGVHHVCVRVPDLDDSIGRLRASDIEPIPPAIREGAEGARVAFIHPRATGGVLLELREAPGGR